MATKSKSNVAKSAKKSSFKFKWWMAVIGIAVIALVGVLVIRLSRASTVKEIGMAESDVKTSVQASRDGYATIGNQTDSSLPGVGAQQTVRVANSNALPRPGYMNMTISYVDKFTYTTAGAVVRYCIYIENTGTYTANGVTLATYGEQKNFPNGSGGFAVNNHYTSYCKDARAASLGTKNTQVTTTFQAYADAAVNAPSTKLQLWKITREVIEAAK